MWTKDESFKSIIKNNMDQELPGFMVIGPTESVIQAETSIEEME